MASTRFFHDPARVAAVLELQTQCGRYALNVPGNGVYMPYQEDVHTRLSKWGANLDRNQIDLENDLIGLNRPPVSKDAFVRVYHNMPAAYAKSAGEAFAAKYSTTTPYTDESRATHPAWSYREASLERWETPFINPQANVELQFPNNIQTRIIEKNNA
jgi:hypothetical protein